MAEINGTHHRWTGDQKPWTSAQTTAQFTTIAWLRWRILRNGMRRKGGLGDVIATLIVVPLFLVAIFGPSLGAGFVAEYFVSRGDFGFLPIILWAIFILCQLTSIQLGQPGTTFDPTQLIRFPLNFRGYAAIRIFFGLISPSNVLCTLMSLSVAIGITIAAPELWFPAFAALAAYALANIFFTRMLFAWVDRWLSTRRAREIFTAIIFIGSMGIQWANFTFNPGFHRGHHTHTQPAAQLATATKYYHSAEPLLTLLPPGLTSNAILSAHLDHPGTFIAELLGVLLFAAAFLAVFSARMYKEFRGENLSDQANAVAKTPAKKHSTGETAAIATPANSSTLSFSAPSTVAAVFGKEFLTMRRNTGIFYALVAPLIMVILFANLKATHTPSYIMFPAAVAYTLMGIAPLCYNSLGFEAAGIQFYFLAPVKMRDVFLAKNLLHIGMAAIEIVAVFFAITYVAHAPDPSTTIAVVLWAAFTMFVTLAVGNWRSVTAPKKIDIAKMAKNQATPLSALISIGLLLVSAGLGAISILVTRYLDKPWILPPAMLVLAVIGFFIYLRSLNMMDQILADHRDTLSETLCKV